MLIVAGQLYCYIVVVVILVTVIVFLIIICGGEVLKALFVKSI